MPAGRPNLSYITIDDFSPGIYDDWMAAGGPTPAPDGAAQLTGTWGCVASRTGALIGAPRKVHTQTQGLIDAGTAGNQYPTGDARMHVLAFRNVSPVYRKLSSGATQSDFADMPFIALQWWFGSAGSFKQKGVVRGYKSFKTAVSTFDVISHASTASQAVGTKPSYGWASIDVSRSNVSHPEIYGSPVVACTYFEQADLATFEAKVFPSNASVATDSTADIIWKSLSIGPYAVFAHQDRLFCLALGTPSFDALGPDFGVDGGIEQTEWIFYTDPNNYAGGTFDNNINFVNENPSGYGSWRSLNAGEVFLVKKRGGGVSVRGDVDRPTVIRLPGVISTGLAVNLGCALPDGSYLYGSETGVWAWSGGDTCALLSPQLEGWFWKATTPASPTAGKSVVDQLCDPVFYRSFGDDHASLMGSWAMCGDRLVFGPNNFIFDSMHKSWWRHTDPADGITYGFHESSVRNRVLAVPYVVEATQTELIAWFDPSTGKSEYQWTSQPLRYTRGRVLNFRELDIVFIGHGTVTVTLTGIDGATQAEVFAVDSDTPIAINRGSRMQSFDVVVEVHSEATDSSVEAPSVKRLILGYEEQMTAREEQ